jgi:ketosteroid isomerase-like protein
MRPTKEMRRGPETELITGWYDAFNRRDLDEMLERFSPAIVFRPLRFPGIEQRYDGHEGIRAWFEAMTGAGHVHRIEAESFADADDDRILVSGSVTLAATGSLAPFSGIYLIEDGRIAEATHYFTPAAVLDRLGMI